MVIEVNFSVSCDHCWTTVPIVYTRHSLTLLAVHQHGISSGSNLRHQLHGLLGIVEDLFLYHVDPSRINNVLVNSDSSMQPKNSYSLTSSSRQQVLTRSCSIVLVMTVTVRGFMMTVMTTMMTMMMMSVTVVRRAQLLMLVDILQIVPIVIRCSRTSRSYWASKYIVSAIAGLILRWVEIR